MSKQPRVAIDPDTLKPIIEAMIFASEEPLSARALLRLLAGDRENEAIPEEVPPLAAMMAESETAPPETAPEEPAAPEEEQSASSAPESPDGDDDASELPPVETPRETVEDDPVETEPVEEISVETAAEEVETPSEEPAVIPVPEGWEEAPEPPAGDPSGGIDASMGVGRLVAIAGPGPDDEDDFSGEETQEIPPEGDPIPDGAVASEDPASPLSGEDAGNEGGTGEGMDIGDLMDALERTELRPVRDERREVPAVLDQAYLRAMIDELNDEYDVSGRAFRIVEVAGGFQFATVRDYGEFVAMLSKDKARRRLSPAALETLAILAYRQPVSKPEVEAIRGVNCDQVLLSLMEKNLIAITGRSEAVGRPLLYGTTEEFLRIFGLRGIGDLPKLREIEELMEEDAYNAEPVITVDAGTDAEEIEAKVGAAGHVHHDMDAGEALLSDGVPPAIESPGESGNAAATPEQPLEDAGNDPGEQQGGIEEAVAEPENGVEEPENGVEETETTEPAESPLVEDGGAADAPEPQESLPESGTHGGTEPQAEPGTQPEPAEESVHPDELSDAGPAIAEEESAAAEMHADAGEEHTDAGSEIMDSPEEPESMENLSEEEPSHSGDAIEHDIRTA